MLPDSGVERALAVMAHPDDVDFGCAGTVASWTAAGVAVTYLIITDGDAGGFDPAVPRADIPDIRRAEQRAAAQAVGVADVRFLGYPDGRLVADLDLRRQIARVIRQVRPQRVLCPSPERNYERMAAGHPDHRAAGAATLDAVYPDARNPFFFPELLAGEGLDAWVVPEVWITAGTDPDTWVDVSDHVEAKLSALRAHVSQTAHVDDLEPRIRDWLTATAREGGLAEGRYAEAFRVVELPT